MNNYTGNIETFCATEVEDWVNLSKLMCIESEAEDSDEDAELNLARRRLRLMQKSLR